MHRLTVDEARRVLGVSEGATTQDIGRARKRRQLQHHPDRGGDTGEAQRINEACDVLLNARGAPPACPPAGPSERAETSSEASSSNRWFIP